MTNVERAIEAMRTSGIDDHHVLAVTRLLDAASQATAEYVLEELSMALTADSNPGSEWGDTVVPPWAQFKLTITSKGPEAKDMEFFSDLDGVKEALRGGMVLLTLSDARVLVTRPPTKAGETNTLELNDAVIVLERVGGEPNC